MVLRKRGGVGWERMVPRGRVIGWKEEGCWGGETWLGGGGEEEEEEEEGCVLSGLLVSIRVSVESASIETAERVVVVLFP